MDAFPINKFIFTGGQWCEVLVDFDEPNSNADYKINFKYAISNPNNENVTNYLQPATTFKDIKVKEGETYELSPERKL
jgi:SAM-dependent MidA family methyltransferase